MDEIITQVLLIDLENCPNQINQLMNHLDEYSHIVICYAQSGAKVPVDWIMPLTTTINSNRLKLVKMPEVGKNAADFGIAFWAGVLMAQLPENTHFDIISNDTDLDYAVSLLTNQNRSAERLGIKKSSEPETQVLTPETPNYLKEYCFHLLSHSKPAKKETLLNSIKAKFKVDDNNANRIFEILVKHSVISINESKINYNQEKLNKFATVV